MYSVYADVHSDLMTISHSFFKIIWARFIRHARNEATPTADGTEMPVEEMPTVGATAAAAARASALAARTEARRMEGIIEVSAPSSDSADGADGSSAAARGAGAAAAGGGDDPTDLENISADEVFDALDLNHNGDITKAEFIRGLCKSVRAASFVGLPQKIRGGDESHAHFEEVFQSIDKNVRTSGSGGV